RSATRRSCAPSSVRLRGNLGPSHAKGTAMHRLATLLALAALCAAPVAAQDAPGREVVGTRTSENIPPIPAELLEQLNRYQSTRSASVAGWTAGGCLLVGTRFAETTQVHRVC